MSELEVGMICEDRSDYAVNVKKQLYILILNIYGSEKNPRIYFKCLRSDNPNRFHIPYGHYFEPENHSLRFMCRFLKKVR